MRCVTSGVSESDEDTSSKSCSRQRVGQAQEFAGLERIESSWQTSYVQLKTKNALQFKALMDFCTRKHSELVEYPIRAARRPSSLRCTRTIRISKNTAKVVNTVSRLLEARDAVSANTQVKLKDAPRLLKLPEDGMLTQFGLGSLVIVIRQIGTRPMTQQFSPRAILYGHPLAGLLWERKLEKYGGIVGNVHTSVGMPNS